MVNKKGIVDQISKVINSELITLKQDLEGLQSSLQNETKSSAGDKYETGREMITQEINKINAQINKNEKNLQSIKTVNVKRTLTEVSDTALVECSIGLFFIGLPLGVMPVGKEKVYCISPASPIYQAIRGLKTGDTFAWQNKKIEIISIS